MEQAQGFSTHFTIGLEGGIDWVGHCQLLTDKGGVYRGNRVGVEPLEERSRQVGESVCRQLARAGYWGPVGIDGLVGTLAGEPVWRPLLEINARCSFGRLTLALGDWIPRGWVYLWWFPPRTTVDQVRGLPPLPEPGARAPGPGVYALPLSVDPETASQTAVLLAPDSQELAALEATLS